MQKRELILDSIRLAAKNVTTVVITLCALLVVLASVIVAARLLLG